MHDHLVYEENCMTAVEHTQHLIHFRCYALVFLVILCVIQVNPFTNFVAYSHHFHCLNGNKFQNNLNFVRFSATNADTQKVPLNWVKHNSVLLLSPFHSSLSRNGLKFENEKFHWFGDSRFDRVFFNTGSIYLRCDRMQNEFATIHGSYDLRINGHNMLTLL